MPRNSRGISAISDYRQEYPRSEIKMIRAASLPAPATPVARVLTARSLAATIVAAAILAVATPASADTLVVHNVNGYTMTRAGLKSFRTIVVTDGKVEQILSTDSANVRAGASVVDGAGNTLLPGLTDAHGHVLGLGQE